LGTAAALQSEGARRAASRLEEFRGLGARGALCTEVCERLATEAAEEFLAQHLAAGEYLTDAIALLAEIATLEEPCLSETGQRATFPLLVEQLSDSFEPALCDLYDRVFTQLITHCRTLPVGARLDAALRNFGLHAPEYFLERKARLRRKGPWRDEEEQRRVRRVRRVLVLSRVTLGADVAVTSIVLNGARDLFPEARRVLLGPAKARELFGGALSLDIREVEYRSGGTLIERLESWLEVIHAVKSETDDLKPHEYVLIDPDSRYLQLGLLPALKDESRYYFFESRRAGGEGSKALSELTADWLEETFGGMEAVQPRVALRRQDQELGQQVRRRLEAGGARWIVAMSYGVGGNDAKRLAEPFEEQLVERLIEEGCTVVLDQGAGEEEAARTKRLADSVQGRGGRVVEASADSGGTGEGYGGLPGEMMTWRGGIGAWAGLVGASDEYIGYDSAGQHIAAALGIPTIGIFSASSTERFRQRWRPTGPGIVRVIVEKALAEDSGGPSAALEEVIAAHREIRSARNR
jgi:ADP-heptose:LPS heptosyltransferase